MDKDHYPTALIYMEKSFYYSFHDGNISRFSVPLYNGQVVTNRFMHKCLYPQSSLPAYLSAAVTGPEMALQDPDEFANDTATMVSIINAKKLSSNIDTSYMEAVAYIVAFHIKRHGRLFVADLGAYLDEVSWLMFGFGFKEDFLKNHSYPQMAYILVRDLDQYIKEETPCGIIPFTSTNKWNELKNYCQEKGL